MSLEVSLAGKTVLVTGGTRGIGHAIATLLAQAGADLIITGTREDTLEQSVASLSDAGPGSVLGWVAQLTDAGSMKELCARMAGLDGLHGLVNNAGANRIVPIDQVEDQDLEHINALNLLAPTRLIRAAAPIMRRQQWGRIVNLASIWSVMTKPGRAMYTSSKFGLVGLTKACAADLGPDNILVNAISPGFTMTDMTKTCLSQEEMDALSAQVPMRRFAQPEEMARVVLFLMSDLNTYITGQNIVVDGGFVCV